MNCGCGSSVGGYGSDMFSNHPRSFPTGSAPSFSFYTPASFPKLLEVIADLEEQNLFFSVQKNLFEKKLIFKLSLVIILA